MNKELVHEGIGLFMHTDRLHKKLCEKRIGELKIHRSQHVMLMKLSRFRRSVSQKELADCLSITPSAATVSIKKLIAGGYVERKESEKDARFNEISITEKGEKVVLRSKEIFDLIDAQMVSGIGKEELMSFIATLKKMEENLKGQIL